jgi:hypothetical protein
MNNIKFHSIERIAEGTPVLMHMCKCCGLVRVPGHRDECYDCRLFNFMLVHRPAPTSVKRPWLVLAVVAGIGITVFAVGVAIAMAR